LRWTVTDLARTSIVLAMLGTGILPAKADPGQPQAAQPQAPQPQAVTTPFDSDGYALTATVTKQECLVVTSIDLKTMVEKKSDLQAKGIIRPDVDTAHVKAHAWTTAAAFALKVEPLFIVTVFKNSPEIDNCHFGQAIIGFDGKPEIAYMFSMDRAEYNKVDWTSFKPADLPNVVQNFTIGPATAQHMNDEAKIGD
jgi:hypothetical protein